MEVKIYYQKSQFFSSLIISGKFHFVPDVTHELMETKELDDNCKASLEQLFFHYNWMWNNEGECTPEFTRKVRESKDVRHSSMSVGDVVEANGKIFVVADCGFDELVQAYVPKDALDPIFDKFGNVIK